MKQSLCLAALIGLTLSGCFGEDEEISSASTDIIATCGAGISIAKRSALNISLDDGFGLSVGRREALRAAFLDGFPESDLPSRVLAYTEYVGCVTNRVEREIALSEILERKIRFLSHMESQGLSNSAIKRVSELYDEQYAATQRGAVAQANQKLGNIAVAYFEALNDRGVSVGPPLPMPPPPPPAPYDGPPLTDEQIRRMELEAAKGRLERIAQANTEATYSLLDAQEVCAEGLTFQACSSGWSQVDWPWND